MTETPTDPDDAPDLAEAFESIEATADACLVQLKSIAESLNSMRDGIQRASAAIEILAAKSKP